MSELDLIDGALTSAVNAGSVVDAVRLHSLRQIVLCERLVATFESAGLIRAYTELFGLEWVFISFMRDDGRIVTVDWLGGELDRLTSEKLAEAVEPFSAQPPNASPPLDNSIKLSHTFFRDERGDWYLDIAAVRGVVAAFHQDTQATLPFGASVENPPTVVPPLGHEGGSR